MTSLVAATAVALAACTSTVDVKDTLAVAEATGGWYDAGIVEGKNKIVPMVTFRLTKKAAADVDGAAVNVVFRQVPAPGASTEDEWDEVFLQNVTFAEETQTAPLTVRTEKGYTGDPPQSRLDLFENSAFRDVRARVFAKYNSTQWVEIGAIDVPRRLLTR